MAEEEKKEESAKELLEESVKGLQTCVDTESIERGKMLDDLRFATLDQWPSDIRAEREGDAENGPRPCLTIDQINQYIVQVLNDIRQGKPGIKVRPVDDAADVETAKILQGLVRNIEDQSSAEIAYMTAAESAVKIGLGYFRITTEYAGDDSFDQEIVIKPIPNTFSTYLGAHVMPDGSDAEEGYIVEQMPTEEFKAKYPEAKVDHTAFENLGDQVTFWRTEETITVVERFYIEKEYENLYFLEDGTTIAQSDYDKWPEEAGPKPKIEDERIKTKKTLHWCKLTGAEVLEERDLPGKYIPIIEVVGRETHLDGERKLWGLVRPAKDSLRMYNYWASTITEKIALAPKAPYIGMTGQFASQNDRWKKANRTNYPYLEVDAVDNNGQPAPLPRREPPPPIESAMVQQLTIIREDVKASLGMYKAALGQSESQQSGKAILALQRESDTGTYHFGANVGVSIRHAGRIIVDMIPHYYDTKRVVRILGEDGEMQPAHIDPNQQESMRQINTPTGIKRIYNPGVGTFDVTTTVGPSYNTKRMEAAATFVELARGATDPATASVLRYLTVKNSDSAGADEATKMLRALLPPQVADPNEPIPPHAMAKIAQMGQALQTAQEQGQKLAQENQQLKAGVAQAHIKAASEERIATMEARIEQAAKEQEAGFKRFQHMQEAAFEQWKALLAAKTAVEVAEVKAGAVIAGAQISAANAAAGQSAAPS